MLTLPCDDSCCVLKWRKKGKESEIIMIKNAEKLLRFSHSFTRSLPHHIHFVVTLCQRNCPL